MLGKSSKPVIEILTGSLVSGNRAGPVDVATSPINHMEPKTRSHRGLKSFDFGGVGLGIVTALEKSGNKALFGRNLSRSNPIPFKPPNNPSRICRNSEGNVEMESSEEYTIVRCHGPNKSYTKVYPNGVESEQNGDDKIRLRIRSSIKSNRGSVFHISPGKNGEAAEIPSPDFLSACNLCHKELHGKDIYMYRGEKAFCSTECRYRQMAMDERTEKCCSEAVEVAAAGSPCANDRILTAGIMAI